MFLFVLTKIAPSPPLHPSHSFPNTRIEITFPLDLRTRISTFLNSLGFNPIASPHLISLQIHLLDGLLTLWLAPKKSPLGLSPRTGRVGPRGAHTGFYLTASDPLQQAWLRKRLSYELLNTDNLLLCT